MSDINRIDIKEFREIGFLQELNRQFLHPLGLALEVNIDEDGKETLGGVWDYRKDEEGMLYSVAGVKEPAFLQKVENVNNERDRHSKKRIEMFGNIIQPI